MELRSPFTTRRSQRSRIHDTISAMSKNGYSVLQELSSKASARTVQVTVVPRPNRFSERRAVLHSLQRFANVEVFKKLEVSLRLARTNAKECSLADTMGF